MTLSIQSHLVIVERTVTTPPPAKLPILPELNTFRVVLNLVRTVPVDQDPLSF